MTQEDGKPSVAEDQVALSAGRRYEQTGGPALEYVRTAILSLLVSRLLVVRDVQSC